MKKALFFFACLLALSGCGPKDLTLVSYNVGVFHKSGGNSCAEVASMLTEVGADAVGLCELDSCNRRSQSYQLEDLLSNLGKGWKGHFTAAIPFAGGSYGIGTATKAPILKTRDIVLPRSGNAETRVASVIETPGYVLAVTHLEFLTESMRLNQAAFLSDTLKSLYSHSLRPVFLCGDFNALPSSRTIDLMRKDWDILSPSQASYPAILPVACIDYIMVLRGTMGSYRVVEAEAKRDFTSGDASTASDHLPVVVKLTRRPTSADR